MKVSGVIYVLVFQSCLYASAQSYDYRPDIPAGYFYNFSIVHPGYVPSEGLGEFGVNYKFGTGALKDVTTLAVTGGKVWGQEKKATHVGRLLLHNEQEGPYIQYPRAYVNYAFRIAVGEETYLSSGLAVGTGGVYFSAPSATASNFLPDASWGIGLRHKGLSLGTTVYQLFNSTSSPLLSTLKLRRYYQTFLNFNKEVGLDWNSHVFILWRAFSPSYHEIQGSFLLEYKERLGLGAGYKWRAGMALFASFKIQPETNALNILFTYNSSFFSDVPRLQNSMEIGISYSLF